MLACPPEIELRLYEDALLDLGRAARDFAAAVVRATETSERIEGEAAVELAARILDDCRTALLPAFVRAPGMLQMFVAAS